MPKTGKRNLGKAIKKAAVVSDYFPRRFRLPTDFMSCRKTDKRQRFPGKHGIYNC